jgi:hypothetical protein
MAVVATRELMRPLKLLMFEVGLQCSVARSDKISSNVVTRTVPSFEVSDLSRLDKM